MGTEGVNGTEQSEVNTRMGRPRRGTGEGGEEDSGQEKGRGAGGARCRRGIRYVTFVREERRVKWIVIQMCESLRPKEKKRVPDKMRCLTSDNKNPMQTRNGGSMVRSYAS
jgi:hypothetical protein